MENNPETKGLNKLMNELSSEFNYDYKETAIILAAGHGKRIKSQRSKMLHKIWEVPTVERVYNACLSGIDNINNIIVVGIKAKDVMEVIGKRPHTLFALQEEQNGTGHAVQVALEKINPEIYDGIIYVLPGDMGLINKETISMFRKEFVNSGYDMMVLTGKYTGDPNLNNYGRIVRVKEKDSKGKFSDVDFRKVIEIIEYKDILSMDDTQPYVLKYNGRSYVYSKQELINNEEFNSGVYAFKSKKLFQLINRLSNNNVQKEIYITDLISLFNQSGYTVGAVSPEEQHVIMGFNDKSVLREMESVARSIVYEKLKNIIEINDPDDFFIDEKVVENILEMDKKGIPLDIEIGKGVYIGKGVKLNYNICLKKNVHINGNIILGKNVTIWENAHLSCFPNQTLNLGNNVEILWGDIIKGNIIIGDNSRIESSVNITGSDEYPLVIGKNVLIKGTSYIFGSFIEDDLWIEHSVLIRKKVKRILSADGNILAIKYFLPDVEGKNAIDNLD
jgi:bifunctional UDP-N-acetylglucosamine pyrophosphorylase / glucosamine-1-phosphate N-acetyltransferase